MLKLVDADWKSPEESEETAFAPAQSVGHRFVEQACQALAAGDELVAAMLLDMAYAAFDNDFS